MYVNSQNDRKEARFMCIKDVEDGKKVRTIISKPSFIYVGMLISINSSSFMNHREFVNNLDSNKLSHERVIPNQKLKTGENYQNVRSNQDVLICRLRGGENDNQLPEHSNQNLEKINQNLKETAQAEKLRENIISKIKDYPTSFTDYSFNKIFSEFFGKLDPLLKPLLNQKIWAIVAKSQKQLKPSDVSISVDSSSKSKNIIGYKTQNRAKKSSSIFVNGLVPINPYRWPGHAIGSAMASDMPDFLDKIKTPLDNLQVVREYLATSQSDIQYRSRAWKVAEDLALINIIAETNDLGPFATGMMANQFANWYMDEMIQTQVSRNDREELNLQIFKEVAREDGRDPLKIRGTGTIRENVPDYMKEDICKRPERKARPRAIKDDFTISSYEDKLDFN